MAFDATPINMTTLLVVGLAVVAVVYLFRGVYTSNLPLLFYAAALTMSTMTDRSVNIWVLYVGLAFALILRFEFMGTGFTKFIAMMTSSAMLLAALAYLDQIFGSGTMLS
jgi:hypothetical protein